MSSVASKNLYDLLGNDPDQDPELRTEPPAPVAPVDKQTARKGKRDAPTEAPAASVAPVADSARGRGRGRGVRGRGRGGARGGNEEAFLDADAGRTRNRDKPVDDAENRGRARGRGGRGRSFRDPRDDRHSRTIHQGPDDQNKQAAHGWGGNTGESEWNDETAGDAIAREESKQGNDSIVDPPVNAEGEHPVGEEEAEPEPEDKTKSYADYLAEQAEKKLQLGGNLEARKANEGAANKQPEGKAFEKDESEYVTAVGGKTRRERERKEKNVYVLEHDIQAREQASPRGGRGGRGGRARGEFRGRGGGRGRGEFRGRGGRGGAEGPTPNVTNTSDFPSLGS